LSLSTHPRNSTAAAQTGWITCQRQA